MIDRADIDIIVEVVSSRMEEREAALKAEFYTALEAMRSDFYEIIQTIGQNQTNLYETMATRFDPGILTAEVHEFWKRGILAEAERIRREVEAAVEFEPHPAPGDFDFGDQPEHNEAVATDEARAKVKTKPVSDGD